jgi:peptide/nickel transport system substrate-binding protein
MFRRSLLTGLLASSVKIAPALAHPVPKRGGKLVYAAGTDVQTLDPQMIGDIPTARIVMQMYETLVAQGPDGTIGPQLAASWSTSNDELVWTFALRPGVTFQDGTPFEAEAVKATFDRLRDPATRSPRRSALEPVASIDVVDPHTVRLTTKAPYAPLLATLSSYNLAILSPAQIRAKGAKLGEAPAGTGPFKLQRWDRGERISLVRNDAYWGEPALLDAVEARVVPEDSARTLLLMGRQVDAVSGVSTILLPRLQSIPSVTLIRQIGYRTIYLGLNMAVKPFDDLRVRQAVAHAIDVKALLSGVLHDAGKVGGGLESPAIEGATDLPPYKFDPALGRKLLEEAGLKQGFQTSFWVPTGRYTADRQLGEAVQAQLATIGIHASLQTPEFGALSAALNTRDKVPMFLLGKGSPTGDLDFTLTLTVDSNGSINYSHLNDPEIDRLIVEQRRTLDPAKRKELLQRIQRRVYDEVPVVVLSYEEQIFATSASVHDVAISANEMISFKRAWKD